MMPEVRITIWNEFRHEKTEKEVQTIYPRGMHEAIADAMRKDPSLRVRTATLDEEDHGLSPQVLSETDVLIWWGHVAHGEVKDEVVDRVQQRVLEGMGLVVLHSGHLSKIFRRLMGTSCTLRWREAAEKERLWVVKPSHPIVAGIGPYFELPATEMYGEFFDIPQPDEVLFISWFQGGEVFRSGAVWTRGKGRIFYFRPGHETFPIYYDEQVLKVIHNAVRWLRFRGTDAVSVGSLNPAPLEVLHRRRP
ncbi:MAG: ThuA domain-containing protein [Planctomycetota bacterium]